MNNSLQENKSIQVNTSLQDYKSIKVNTPLQVNAPPQEDKTI